MQELANRKMQYLALGLLALIAVFLSVAALVRSLPAPDAEAATPNPSVPAVTANAAATPSPTPQRDRTAVFLGDRYTAGAQWPQQVADALGWEPLNLAEAGMGFRVAPNNCQVKPCTPFKGLVPRVAQLQPDVVVLAGGEADGDYDLTPYAASTIAEFRQALPDAQILVLPPPSAQNPQPYWLTMHAQSLREAAGQANATFVDATAVTAQSGSYADGVLTAEAGQRLAELAGGQRG